MAKEETIKICIFFESIKYFTEKGGFNELSAAGKRLGVLVYNKMLSRLIYFLNEIKMIETVDTYKSFSCEQCDKVFDTQRDLKTHTYTHSFTEKSNRKTCKFCDFEHESLETMEVHVGKCGIDGFECGLCEAKFEEVNTLEIHLKTCEVYECGKCWIRNQNLSEMKRHIEETHSTSVGLNYFKMDRNKEWDVSSKFYSFSEV